MYDRVLLLFCQYVARTALKQINLGKKALKTRPVCPFFTRPVVLPVENNLEFVVEIVCAQVVGFTDVTRALARQFMMQLSQSEGSNAIAHLPRHCTLT